jgi:glutamyl-tRNA synthetase
VTKSKDRGRLAPSPTGAQHVGNARTYLITWLQARSRGAALPLRIEDIDSPRIKEGARDLILDDLRWLGLDWDGEPVIQSRRLPLYEQALQRLKEKDLVYPCTCTRSDVAQAASAPHAGQEGTAYPGTCAHRQPVDAANLADQPFAWRFRVTRSRDFVDEYLGTVRVPLDALGGDFVVWKSAGTPAYQLAVVVDDADMGITEVVRGDDLVPSTPRQLLLYQALDRTSPSYVHVPLVVGPDGRRLAKRHGDTRLVALRETGVQPQALIGLLAWSCGWVARPEPITAKELLPRFRLDTIPRDPFVLTDELLRRIGYAA